MQGSTNVPSVPVKSVNNKTGSVIVNAGDVPYVNTSPYSNGSVGKALRDMQDRVESIVPGFSYKGSVTAVSDLPSPATQGDMYTVANEGYATYVYDGTGWHEWDTDVVTNGEIDDMFV